MARGACAALCLAAPALALVPALQVLEQRLSAPAVRDRAGAAAAAAADCDPAPPTFGRLEFWDDGYRDGAEQFSWYCGWDDLAPFWEELVPDRQCRCLLPGVGSDRAMVDMFDAGWERLAAFDYAPSGVERAAALFGSRRVELRVADARSLPYASASFGAALDKGTLDAVYLSGGSDAAGRTRELESAVGELARVLAPGGVVLSVSAAAAEHVAAAFGRDAATWQQLHDGGLWITAGGYASINVDASLLAWERL